MSLEDRQKTVSHSETDQNMRWLNIDDTSSKTVRTNSGENRELYKTVDLCLGVALQSR